METPEQPLLITPEMLLGRRVDFERRMPRRPPVTLAIIGVLAIVFLVERARGALDSAASLIAKQACRRAWPQTSPSVVLIRGGAGRRALDAGHFKRRFWAAGRQGFEKARA